MQIYGKIKSIQNRRSKRRIFTMNYNQTLTYIHSRPKLARVLGNDNLKALLSALGNPHKKLKFVHIGGTNGKGSTAAIIARTMQYSGYKTGLFTSPFIERFNERISINGQDISDTELATSATYVRDIMERTGLSVSEFAFVTAVGFYYFSQKNCDIVILEVGMGGLLDATNVIEKSEVSVLTLIGLDHTQYLGNTIEEIAKTKCGIIKNNGIVISYPCQPPKASEIIQEECLLRRAKLIIAESPVSFDGFFNYKGNKYSLALAGAYQPYNAATSIETLFALRERGFNIPDERIRRAVAETTWKARFEIINDKLIIDGSHNIDGIRALRKSLEALNRRIILVIAMMQDKDYEACIKEIAPATDLVVATQVSGIDRCLSAVDLSALLSPFVITKTVENAIDAVRLALSLADGGIVCTCGSLYLAGEIRAQLKELNVKN
jgi:dihydrofolate synthase/folylpolyglutamate synthase